jgi:hypothetical protein
LAKAYISDEIERDFCIRELNKFMSALSLFNNPEVILTDDAALIKGDDNYLEYRYADERTIKAAPEGEPRLTDIDIQFTLTNNAFQTMRKAMAILQNDLMVVVGNNGTLSIETRDSKKMIKDKYTLQIGETTNNFEFVLKGEHLKLLPLDYEVSISAKGFSWFKNPDVEYWIVLDATLSKFESME